MRELKENPEAPGDALLVATARVARIIDDMYSITAWRNCEPPSTPFQPPDIVHIKAYRANLDEMKATTPPDVLQDSVFSLTHLSSHIYSHFTLYTVLSKKIMCVKCDSD